MAKDIDVTVNGEALPAKADGGLAAFEQSKGIAPGMNQAAIPISGGGYFYVRRPSEEQWDEWQVLSEGGGVEGRKAYKRMVAQCFIGAFVPGTGELSLSEVSAIEGPAFITGPVGRAINHLAGLGERPTKFL